MEAVALMQEWCAPTGPGGKAGCSAANTRIHSGSVGVAESRLEVRASRPARSLF